MSDLSLTLTVPRYHATLCKTFTFDAAHFIPTVPPEHKCRRMHGHTYRVDLLIHDEVMASGFAGNLDYADIAKVWDERVHSVLDHRTLNEVPGLELPTTEVLAGWIALTLIDLLKPFGTVRVYESSTTYCEVTAIDVIEARARASEWPRAMLTSEVSMIRDLETIKGRR